MLRLGQVAALKEIGAQGQAGEKLEIRGKDLNKADRDPHFDTPSAGNIKGRNLQQLLEILVTQAAAVVTFLAKAHIHTAVRIDFKVEIPVIAVLGAEEKFQTAILTHRVQIAGVFPMFPLTVDGLEEGMKKLLSR